MGIFGDSKKEVWNELSTRINADFVDGGFFGKDKVVVHVKEWTITLDTYTVSSGKTHHTYTRMRAPYVNQSGFRFKIYRSGVFSDLGKLLGMQDIEVGSSEFDENFVIKGNDIDKVKALFSNTSIQSLIEFQPRFHLEVKDDDGLFREQFPEEVDELRFEVLGIIKDIDLLKALFDLFAEILDYLCEIGLADDSDPNVEL